MPDITEMKKIPENLLRIISLKVKIETYDPNILFKVFLFESITFITINELIQ